MASIGQGRVQKSGATYTWTWDVDNQPTDSACGVTLANAINALRDRAAALPVAGEFISRVTINVQIG